MEKESRIHEMYQRIINAEDFYNFIRKTENVRLTGPQKPDSFGDIYLIDDPKVIKAIRKYSAESLNKLKAELKEELDKVL